MNNVFKRIFTIAIGLVVMLSVSPGLIAQAATKTLDTETYYLRSTTSTEFISIYAAGARSVKNIKSTNKKVVKPDGYQVYVETSRRISTDSKGKESKGDLEDNTYSNVYFIGLKEGQSTISYTVGKTEYKKKIYIKKYVNPLKTLTISNVNGGKNIAGKFKKSNNVSLKGKTANKLKVTAVAANGWEIERITASDLQYTSVKKGNVYWGTNQVGNEFYRYFKAGTTNATLNMSPYSASRPGSVSVRLRNKKNNGTLTVYTYINDSSRD